MVPCLIQLFSIFPPTLRPSLDLITRTIHTEASMDVAPSPPFSIALKGYFQVCSRHSSFKATFLDPVVQRMEERRFMRYLLRYEEGIEEYDFSINCGESILNSSETFDCVFGVDLCWTTPCFFINRGSM
ncbi:hypothetical protein TNCV_4612031 [Trichonephila clavipes]|nr:hypothetical protein TNCV_4612031 [Trichonephila clavipes]